MNLWGRVLLEGGVYVWVVRCWGPWHLHHRWRRMGVGRARGRRAVQGYWVRIARGDHVLGGRVWVFGALSTR